MLTTIEFWPEYGDGPLWTTDGDAVDLSGLALSSDLAEALRAWNANYDDSKLPFEKNDQAWREEGVRLLAAVRVALSDRYDVVVTEPWWGQAPNA
jgi:hypothetical protein